MEKVTNFASLLAKKIIADHDLANKQELSQILDNLKTANEEDIYHLLTIMLDFVIKNKCYDKYKYYFEQIVSEEKNNQEISLTNQKEIKHLFDFLSTHHINYYLTGSYALNYSLKRKFTGSEITLLIKERDLDNVFAELYQNGYDIFETRPTEILGRLNEQSYPYALLSNDFKIVFKPFTINKDQMITKSYQIVDGEIKTFNRTLTKEDQTLLYIMDTSGIKRETNSKMYYEALLKGTKDGMKTMIELRKSIDYQNVKAIKEIAKRKQELEQSKEGDPNGLQKII